ncbi:uncharacterized protein BT62DRAFT_883617 [Guyanagaster necrorhizus]|uniref:DUF7587 domain-containing protein n=1 Tax=Guyanagaster necrorhizus TaxID=856835 RepID=A0A9P8AZ38_9AGAR|nr:uncharacterized protein BT62DRAFT_883617 [Guyanagaster necrorhizus MCA 3950]KAG7451567.1 hypothetical protein BT62DRAFT_883617 [Guyanagaster necrorhizus MCA 3950]
MLDDAPRCLPRHGFEGEYDFDSLVDRNPFLFRVYTPKPASPSISYDPKIFCIAPKFDAKFTSPPSAVESLSPIGPLTEIVTCEEVARHLDWTTRSTSSFISTSFSFAWAIWEALRRYKSGVKHDVEIAVIDAASLKGRAVTAMQILRKATIDERPHHYWRSCHFSQESQSVVVYGYIPLTSVMASIPLLSILEKMPSYFLRSGIPSNPSVTEMSLINRVAWDPSNKKYTYRQFCEAMTDRYFEQSTEMRLKESIVGSIRLAVAFLNPWFHKTAADDIDRAVHKTVELASLIAAWPDPQDPAEMQDVLNGMVSLLAEEVREKHQVSLLGEVVVLAGVIDEIECVVSSLEDRIEQHEAAAGNPVVETRLDDEFPEALSSLPPSTPFSALLPPSPESSCQEIESFTSDSSSSSTSRSMIAETMSVAITGFLFGTFLTLCVVSSQRRTLLMHLT